MAQLLYNSGGTWTALSFGGGGLEDYPVGCIIMWPEEVDSSYTNLNIQTPGSLIGGTWIKATVLGTYVQGSPKAAGSTVWKYEDVSYSDAVFGIPNKHTEYTLYPYWGGSSGQGTSHTSSSYWIDIGLYATGPGTEGYYRQNVIGTPGQTPPRLSIKIVLYQRTA